MNISYIVPAILVMLILPATASAYNIQHREYINNTRITIYDADVNIASCMETLRKYEPWMNGLVGIVVIPIPGRSNYLGVYLWNQRVIRFSDCGEDTLIHELAHHKNHNDWVSYDASAAHKQVFYDAGYSIAGSVNATWTY